MFRDGPVNLYVFTATTHTHTYQCTVYAESTDTAILLRDNAMAKLAVDSQNTPENLQFALRIPKGIAVYEKKHAKRCSKNDLLCDIFSSDGKLITDHIYSLDELRQTAANGLKY